MDDCHSILAEAISLVDPPACLVVDGKILVANAPLQALLGQIDRLGDLVAAADRATVRQILEAAARVPSQRVAGDVRLLKENEWKEIRARQVVLQDQPMILVEFVQESESLESLAGGIAHDFNNVLSPILILSNLILAQKNLCGDVRQWTEEIAQATGRAAGLVRTLLRRTKQQEEDIGSGSMLEAVLEEKDMSLDGHRVLVVEDDELGCRVLVLGLEMSGMVVTACSNGAQAIERFRENPSLFDVVVSDLMMPELTGDILATQIKEIRPEIPFVMLSGYGQWGAELAAVDAWLCKPAPVGNLVSVIRSML